MDINGEGSVDPTDSPPPPVNMPLQVLIPLTIRYRLPMGVAGYSYLCGNKTITI